MGRRRNGVRSLEDLLESPSGSERIAHLTDSTAVIERERTAMRHAASAEQPLATPVEVGDGEVRNGAAPWVALRIGSVKKEMDFTGVHQLGVTGRRGRP